MKKLSLFIAIIVISGITTPTFAHAHRVHYSGHYHYHSTPTYLVKSEYKKEQMHFPNCSEHILITETNTNYYSNNSQYVYTFYTIMTKNGKVLEEGCTDVNHFVYNKKHYFIVKKNRIYRIIDGYGNTISKRQYSYMNKIGPNKILVKSNKKYGIIDIYENILIPIKFKEFKEKGNNLYITKLNGYYGIVDKKSCTQIIKNQYDKIEQIFDIFVLKKCGKYELLDINGNKLSNKTYEKIKNIDEYIIGYTKNNCDIYNSTGKLISSNKYSKVRLKRNTLEGYYDKKWEEVITNKI